MALAQAAGLAHVLNATFERDVMPPAGRETGTELATAIDPHQRRAMTFQVNQTSIALTFDDGPDERGTPALLETLASCEARATFFVIAPRAAALPWLVERILADGHGIGLHCDVHVRHTQRDRAWLEDDTGRALSRLQGLGVSPTLWRAPWGETAPWTESVARRHGLRLIHWTVDTHDWRGDDAATMFASTCSRLQPGAIVLAHDGIGPGARRDDARETAAFVRLVADHAERRRIRLRALA